jgi:hypothetical protein
MNKTELARICFDHVKADFDRVNDSTEISDGAGVVRPRQKFRQDVVDEIMKALGTNRQNAGTYFGRIFRGELTPGDAGRARKKRSIQRKQRSPATATQAARRKVQKKLLDDNEWLTPKKPSGSHSRDIDEQDMGTGFLENLDITPEGDIQAPIKKIDKPMAIYLGNEAMELIKVLEEYHGLEISRSKSKFEDGFYQMDIRFCVKDPDGNTQTPEAQDFLDYGNLHNIPKEFLFKEFEVDGKALCIIGWKRRATKNKVLFLKDGKRFVTPVSRMKRYLSKAGLIDG